MLHVRFKNSDLFLAKYLCMQSKLKAILYLESISQFICCFYVVPLLNLHSKLIWFRSSSSIFFFVLICFYSLLNLQLQMMKFTSACSYGKIKGWRLSLFTCKSNSSQEMPFILTIFLSLLCFFLFFFFEKQTQSLRDYHSLIWP